MWLASSRLLAATPSSLAVSVACPVSVAFALPAAAAVVVMGVAVQALATVAAFLRIAVDVLALA
ncbi:MAG: hypothetical protein IT365_26995 [Candidatus Hydrogenedentes bacterium]|nr:hypothetical protein [Candidatus Hydrogenedentota bacterium]